MRLLPRRRIRSAHFEKQWQQIQVQCANRKTWPQAIIKADELVFKALKRRRYKGHSTGEKLVSAQHDINFNDAIWYSHKFAVKLKEETYDIRKLRKKDVISALAGFREALRDLGALRKSSHDN